MKTIAELKEIAQANSLADWTENDPCEEWDSMFNALQELEDNEPVRNLSHYVAEDDVKDALERLHAQEEKDPFVLADDVVLMWSPLEGKFTVSELLELID